VPALRRGPRHGLTAHAGVAPIVADSASLIRTMRLSGCDVIKRRDKCIETHLARRFSTLRAGEPCLRDSYAECTNCCSEMAQLSE
jgi:hypothetical protein